jgi:hypothetical protein
MIDERQPPAAVPRRTLDRGCVEGLFTVAKLHGFVPEDHPLRGGRLRVLRLGRPAPSPMSSTPAIAAARPSIR